MAEPGGDRPYPQAPAAHHSGPRPAGANPYGGNDPYSQPPEQGRGQDTERTVSMMRPKTPLPQGPAPQDGPRGDEGAFTTTRLPRNPNPGSPGLQVYPPASPQQHPQQMPHPHGPQYPPGAQHPPSGPQRPPLPPPEANDGPGLGTDLFSIVGPEQQRPSNRTGMLVLMAVAAGAAVVIAILIVALLTN